MPPQTLQPAAPRPRARVSAMRPAAESLEPAPHDLHVARLRRIEGQVRGLQTMLAEERPCAEVLTQIAAVQKALGAVALELARSHAHRAVRWSLGADHVPEGLEIVDQLLVLTTRFDR